MSTARTCTTPEEGWGLYSHFLDNLLMAIRFAIERREKDGNEKFENVINSLGARLIGYLYLIVRRMTQNGHVDEAAKMQQILDLVADGDLADLKILELIDAKHEELSSGIREFRSALKELNAEHVR